MVKKAVNQYNTVRPHNNIGKLSPVELQNLSLFLMMKLITKTGQHSSGKFTCHTYNLIILIFNRIKETLIVGLILIAKYANIGMGFTI